MKRIQQLPLSDRPREKLVRKGVAALSDFELLEIIIGSGSAGADVGYIARAIQKILHQGIDALTYEHLTAVKGVSVASAGKIMAAIELAKRNLSTDLVPLKTQKAILAQLADIRTKQQEYFVCLSLDGGQRLIAQRIVTIGTLDSVAAHPREVFADATADRAAGIIVAHNHPSGDPSPSQKDITLTQRLSAAGQLLGIQLLDHLIVTKTAHFSCRANHII